MLAHKIGTSQSGQKAFVNQAELMNEGASFSLPIGITDAVLGMHGGAADVVRRTS